MPEQDCNCWRSHARDCKYFDEAQGLRNLEGDIESLQKLLSDGFEVRMFATSQEFVAEVKHPSQTEEFLSDSVLQLIQDIGEWVSHCAQCE